MLLCALCCGLLRRQRRQDARLFEAGRADDRLPLHLRVGRRQPYALDGREPGRLFCEQTGSVNAPLGPAAISAGEAEGLFYTRMPWEKSKEYLFYLYAPYGESNTSTLISGSLSAAQMQNGASSSHVDGLGLAYAAVTASEPSEAPLAVTLKQVFGYLDLSVSTTKWAGWTMESIQIESLTDAALAGSYTFDLTSGKLAFGSDASKSLLLRVSGGELSGEPFHAYAVTAPSDGTPQRYGITVTVARENESSMVSPVRFRSMAGWLPRSRPP